jgi:hypothetical protein
MARTQSDIQADLDAWYAARRAAANGKSITISTSAGARTVSQYDLEDINAMISQLERELTAVQTGRRHDFAVASFNHDIENQR